SGAVMLVAPVVFNHLINGIAARTANELEAAGLFVHERGVEPHYNPATGKIHGDRRRLDDAKIKALQDAHDAHHRQSDVGEAKTNRLGAPDSDAHAGHKAPETPRAHGDEAHPAPQPRKNQGDPYIHPLEGDAAHPHRYLERRELISLKKHKTESSLAGIEKALESEFSVPIGKKLKTLEQGHEILERLARGDASALEKLGVGGVPPGYDT